LKFALPGISLLIPLPASKNATQALAYVPQAEDFAAVFAGICTNGLHKFEANAHIRM